MGWDLGVCLGELIFFFFCTVPFLPDPDKTLWKWVLLFLKKATLGGPLLYVTTGWFHFLKTFMYYIFIYIPSKFFGLQLPRRTGKSCSPSLIAQLSVYLRTSGSWLICRDTGNEWLVGGHSSEWGIRWLAVSQRLLRSDAHTQWLKSPRMN